MLPLPSALPAPQLYTYLIFLLEAGFFAADFAAFFLVAIGVVVSSYERWWLDFSESRIDPAQHKAREAMQAAGGLSIEQLREKQRFCV
jgi:hypothetical protein